MILVPLLFTNFSPKFQSFKTNLTSKLAEDSHLRIWPRTVGEALVSFSALPFHEAVPAEIFSELPFHWGILETDLNFKGASIEPRLSFKEGGEEISRLKIGFPAPSLGLGGMTGGWGELRLFLSKSLFDLWCTGVERPEPVPFFDGVGILDLKNGLGVMMVAGRLATLSEDPSRRIPRPTEAKESWRIPWTFSALSAIIFLTLSHKSKEEVFLNINQGFWTFSLLSVKNETI